MYRFWISIFCTVALADQKINNANHIFNAIHSSARQWGSSLNHNGMSYFAGLIPAGTQVYHGTGAQTPVKGMEWLSFEPELAMLFAWSLENYTSDIIDIPGLICVPTPECLHPDFDRASNLPFEAQAALGEKHIKPGYFHTYAAKRDLNILYIDGSSAGKSSLGTMDTQLYVMSIHNDIDDHELSAERERMEYYCRMASEVTDGHIDGFVRMSTYFELVICDFQDALDTMAIRRANMEDMYVDKNPTYYSHFFQASAARYHGAGTSRITLDYDRMVTAFTMDIDLFKHENPRLNHVPEEMREGLLQSVTKVMRDGNPRNSTNWQDITDLIVTKYSTHLSNLAKAMSQEQLVYQAKLLWRPFLDYDAPNTTLEIESCTNQFLPDGDSIAATAVREVSYKICSTISKVLNSTFEEGRDHILNLVNYLQWTTWKDCGPCSEDEVCYVAMWPFGIDEDHYHPSCKNGSQIQAGFKTEDFYWRPR